MLIKEMTEIMLAFNNGKTIEVKSTVYEDEFTETTEPKWNWEIYCYRIKPQHTYRPYKPEEAHLLIGLTVWREIDLGRVRQIVTINHVNEGYPAPITFANGLGSYTWSLEELCSKWKLYDIATHTLTDTPVGILEDA